MSKKDYIILARALKESRPEKVTPYDERYHGALIAWNVTVENITYELAKDNNRFNRNKFMSAAGYND